MSRVAISFRSLKKWIIENLFAWWKRHLRMYHHIARSEYGLMVQILGDLITYLLLAICKTGIFLNEDGTPGTIQQLDLVI